MDVILFAALLLIIILIQFYNLNTKIRFPSWCILVTGCFSFLLLRSLEILAVLFLLNILLSVFSFRESFSIVDFKKSESEWIRVKSFLGRNKVLLLGGFFLFNVAFFSVFASFHHVFLDPVLPSQILSKDLGHYINSNHWIGILVLFLVCSVLLGISGRKEDT
jgi:hypothetical protein